MHHITLTRTRTDIEVNSPQGQLGFILGRPGDYEAWANQQPKDGFGRAATCQAKTLQEAVGFIVSEGVAL